MTTEPDGADAARPPLWQTEVDRGYHQPLFEEFDRLGVTSVRENKSRYNDEYRHHAEAWLAVMDREQKRLQAARDRELSDYQRIQAEAARMSAEAAVRSADAAEKSNQHARAARRIAWFALIVSAFAALVSTASEVRDWLEPGTNRPTFSQPGHKAAPAKPLSR